MKFTEWIQQLFGRRQLPAWTGRKDFSRSQGYWLDNAYSSDYALNAIDRIASEISKIDVRSVVERDESVIVQNDDITRLFRFGPNPLQTTKDFLSSIEWIRRKFGNVFIYPQYDVIRDAYGRDTKRFREFYVLSPVDFEVGVGTDGNVWEIQFLYPDGKQYVLPYSELIHLKWRRGVNLFKGGGDDNGNMNTTDMLHSINALNQTIEGLPKAIAASMQIKGIYNTKSLIGADQQKIQRDNFEDHILSSKTGIVATDIVGDFTPVNMQVPIISEGNMKFMRSGIVQRFGVSEDILNGSYTGSQHSAFYQTAIEDFIVDAEQAFSRVCFSQREQDIGHRVKFYYSRIKYLSTADQLEMARIARDTGVLTQNQVLDMFGLPPYDGGELRLRSLNYVNANIADEYQLTKADAVSPRDTERDRNLQHSGQQELNDESKEGDESDEGQE